jgi:hypothetical protein
VIALFRNYTPFAVFLLFFLTIFTRLGFWGSAPIIAYGDVNNTIWLQIATWWHSIAGTSTFLNGLIVTVLIMSQALALNRIANRFDLFNNPSYLTAMTYILITALFPSWNIISLFSIVNLLVILLLEKCLKLYLEGNNPYLLINIGIFIACICLLINLPAVIILIATIITLLVFRPFKWLDFARLGFGLLTPYYLTLGLLYLYDKLPLFKSALAYEFKWTLHTQPGLAFLIGVTTMLLLTIGGCYYLSKVLGRMVIHTKRYWWVIFIFLTGCVFILPLTFNSHFSNTILIAPYLALVSSNVWLEHRRRWIPGLTLSVLLIIIYILQWLSL